MSSNFNFYNKKQGNLGNIDFTKIKSGLTKDEIASLNPLVKSLFELLDKNSDEKLNRDEIIGLQNLLNELDKDDNKDISDKEAGRIKLADGKKLKKKNFDALLDLISTLVNKSELEGVVNVSESEEASEIVTYNDGRVEQSLRDGGFQSIENGGRDVKTLNSDGSLRITSHIEDDGAYTITKYENGEIVEIEELTAEGHRIITQGNTTTKYEDGKKTIEIDGRVTEEAFENGVRIIHNEDGSKISEIKEGNTTTSMHFNAYDEIVFEYMTTRNEDGSRTTTATKYDLSDGSRIVTVSDIKGSKRSFKEEKYVGTDGREITLTYDESGNTSGIIVQYKETPSDIAKAFGIELEELFRLNQDKVRGQGNNRYFNIGENLTIPGRVRANSEAVISRNSADEEIAEYELDKFLKEQARIQKEAERLERERQARMSTRGQKVTKADEQMRELYDFGLTNSFGTNRVNETGRGVLAQINASNVIEFYKSFGAVKKGKDEDGNEFLYYTYDGYSLIDALGVEFAGSNYYINEHFGYLVTIAREVGVPVDIISSYQAGFEDAMDGATTAECSINDIFYKFIAIIESYKYYLLPEELEQYRNKFTPENFKNEKEQVISNLELQVRQLELVIDGTICAENYFENLPENIRLLCIAGDRVQLNINDVNVAKRNIARLKGCQSFEEFNKIYKEIFGVEYTLEHLKVAQDQIVIVFESMIDNAYEAFEEQQGHEGFCGWIADKFGYVYGSENIEDKVREDLAKARNGLARLKACNDPLEFEKIYEEIFGVKFDYAQFIAVARKQQEIERHREEARRLDEEIKFLKQYTGEQIVGKGSHDFYGGVHDEYYPTLSMRYEDYCKYQEYGKLDKENSCYKEGRYDKKSYKFVSPELFEDDLESIINHMGGREKVLQNAKQYYAKLWNCSANETKISYEFSLDLIIDYIDAELRSRYDRAVNRRNQLFGGMSVEQAQLDVSNTLNGVLGAKNNIMTRVIEYNMSQQVGGEMVKGLLVAGGAIVATLCGCPWLGMGIAVLGTPTIEAIDSMTTKNARNAVGLKDFLKTAWDEYDGKTVLTNMAVNAVSMVGGMIAARLAITLTENMLISSKLVSKLVEAAIQAQADIAIGLATDMVIHGEVTIDGVIYNVTFAIVGNVISCTACKPKKTNISVNEFFHKIFSGKLNADVDISDIKVQTKKATGKAKFNVLEISIGEETFIFQEPNKVEMQRLLTYRYIKQECLSSTEIAMLEYYIRNINSMDDLISLENLINLVIPENFQFKNILTDALEIKKAFLDSDSMAKPIQNLEIEPKVQQYSEILDSKIVSTTESTSLTNAERIDIANRLIEQAQGNIPPEKILTAVKEILPSGVDIDDVLINIDTRLKLGERATAIADIIFSSNKETFDLFLLKDEHGFPRINSFNINLILKNEDINLIKSLAEIKNPDGSYRYTGENITFLILIYKETPELFEILTTKASSTGELRNLGGKSSEWINCFKSGKDNFIKLLFAEDANGKFLLSEDCLYSAQLCEQMPKLLSNDTLCNRMITDTNFAKQISEYDLLSDAMFYKIFNENPDISFRDLSLKILKENISSGESFKIKLSPEIIDKCIKMLSDDLIAEMHILHSEHIEDIFYQLSFVQEIPYIKSQINDTKFLNMLNQMLDCIDFNNIKYEDLARLREFETVLDVYHTMNNNYTRLRSFGRGTNYSRELHDYLKATKNKKLHKIITNKKTPKNRHQQILYNDFQESNRLNNFIEYCKSNNCDPEIANYLYNEYYLKNLPEEIRVQLDSINTKYGCRIILSTDMTTNISEILRFIDLEFAAWSNASNGECKIIPVLDLLTTKRDYIDTTSAYGKGVSAGFCESNFSGAVSINGNDFSRIVYTLRHEIMHANDRKNLITFPSAPKEANGSYSNKTAWRGEFRNIGIDEYHIDYAYNNPAEFIAVAAEGDLSKCSPEFRQQLIDFGMPEWVFDLWQNYK